MRYRWCPAWLHLPHLESLGMVFEKVGPGCCGGWRRGLTQQAQREMKWNEAKWRKRADFQRCKVLKGTDHLVAVPQVENLCLLRGDASQVVPQHLQQGSVQGAQLRFCSPLWFIMELDDSGIADLRFQSSGLDVTLVVEHRCLLLDHYEFSLLGSRSKCKDKMGIHWHLRSHVFINFPEPPHFSGGILRWHLLCSNCQCIRNFKGGGVEGWS